MTNWFPLALNYSLFSLISLSLPFPFSYNSSIASCINLVSEQFILFRPLKSENSPSIAIPSIYQHPLGQIILLGMICTFSCHLLFLFVLLFIKENKKIIHLGMHLVKWWCPRNRHLVKTKDWPPWCMKFQSISFELSSLS